MVPRTRHHVLNTSDKARAVSVFEFDMDQSYPSRQQHFSDRNGQMLQRNEMIQPHRIKSLRIMDQPALVHCNKYCSSL
jgi:hypothetical protein